MLRDTVMKSNAAGRTSSALLHLSLVTAALLGSGRELEATKPNIVLFFVDDLGWSDLGYRNPAVFESPNIDALARAGTDFQQCYVACPTCSPSRGTILTGQHPVRLKLVRHIYDADPAAGFDASGRATNEFAYLATDPALMPSRNWLPLDVTTYAQALKPLGYYSVFVGKWHLGAEECFPVPHGFDQQIDVTSRGHPRSYYPPYFSKGKNKDEEGGRYLTDQLTDDTVNFIEHYNRKQPFMLSLFYYAVHGPHIGRKDLLRHFEDKGLTGDYAQYATMVKAVDESIGRVREALEKKGLTDNTIIIFTSDQGGFFENKPFHGGKMVDTLYEGGSRVPFIFHWPGVTQDGSTNNSVIQTTDLFPTLVQLAGGDPATFKDMDGISLLSTIKDNSTLQRGEPIYGYRSYEDLYASVREGDWKLLAYRSGTLRLYNIASDIGETNDLASTLPEKVDEMKAQLVAWEKQMGVEGYSGVQSSGQAER
jgi:arylsulfatase A-like enzyme